MARPDPAIPDDPDDDSDALSWAGDEARGVAGPVADAAPEPVAAAAAPEEPAPARPGRALLTVVAGAVFLALTVGWVLAAPWTPSAEGSLPTAILLQFGDFAAIVAAPLWFVAVLTLGADARTGVRAGWFALGVGLLVPWPLILGVLGTAAEVTS